jgi:endonuclease/exonuclease/phosphatase family metal-dependent hydrolase
METKMNLTQLRLLLSRSTPFVGRLSIAAVQVWVIILLTWHVLRLYPGDRWLFVRLGSYFAPWLLLTLLPALVIALLGRCRWLAGGVLLLMLIFGMHYGPLLTPRLSQAKAGGGADVLRVMTFNVHYSNHNAPGIADLIRAESPDVIAMQEMSEGLQLLLLPELAAEYPYYLVDNSWGLPMVLISRYPLTVQPKLPETPRAQLATVETPNGPVAVWNVHPSPAVKQGGWEAQKHALTAVGRAIESESRPLVVLGDFNTTDQAENYRLIANHLTDVHHTVGRGFGFTFPEPDVVSRMSGAMRFFDKVSPIVRIDHVFVSKHFIPEETHVIPSGYGSDHRPVMATLRFADRGEK